MSANMGWWTMFTIYPKVGGGMWRWRQSICLTGTTAGSPMSCWQDSASGSPSGRTVCAEFQEYSSRAVSGATKNAP
ncbi:hypothetical protein SAMN05192563_1011149 [Paraburkholderia aspalathi]|uniref:Uncharacterized protein n=1 Tax=Paraburkholderia aspalathi TaxID=1324617 RepID=A0A1I7DST6_9BURK|nr:hypothetical protein SAMN05192563_1011149 [Paraburkholderia aspalathi]